MQHIFAILPDQTSNRSFERYFKFAYQAELHTYRTPLPSVESSDSNCQWAANTFASISGWLNRRIYENDLSSAIGIVEIYDEKLLDLSRLNPIHTRQTWAAVTAMLILAFPEIHWLFITPHPLKRQAENSSESQHFNYFHRVKFPLGETRLNLKDILKICGVNFSSLFDPFGFRNLIRESVCQTDTDKKVDYIPRRKEFVVSIDEEEDYACFVSYIAYRFGYNAMQVNSFLALTKLNDISPEIFDIAFEDMFLNFPDRPLHFDTLSDLQRRHNDYLAPERIKKLFIVTSGHHESLPKCVQSENQKFLADKNQIFLAANPEASFEINKPFSGIFKFWNAALETENGKPKLAKGYDGTLAKMKSTDSLTTSSNQTGHSAPGRLLLIANCLIKRATRLSDTAKAVKDATLGATLALEAIEYLGYRTPTVSLQALSLKNKLEVMAESMFYGVGYSISQKERFDEIKEEIQCIGKWYKEDGGAELNAEIKIINDMALVFQQQGLFDEESECMEKTRSLYLKLSEKRKQSNQSKYRLLRKVNMLLNGLEHRVMDYTNWLLKSIWNFLFAVFVWVWVFALIFAAIEKFWTGKAGDRSISSFIDNLGHGLYDACIAFFSMQPAHDMSGSEPEKATLILSILCIIISYFHLGIFISYIYSLIIRKQ